MVNRRDDRNGGAQRSRGESQRQRRQDVSHDERYGTYHSSQSLMGWDTQSGDDEHLGSLLRNLELGQEIRDNAFRLTN